MQEIMDGVRILMTKQANPNDTRGETWKWAQHGALELAICRRKTGLISSHFHAGKDPSKNPERLFVAQGSVKFTFFNPKTDERKVLVAEAGTAISIGPGIIHRTYALEYSIILESRTTLFGPKDTDTLPAEI